MAVNGEATRATLSPYQGLLYFRKGDAPFFFGCEEAAGRLLGAVKRRDLIAAGRASGGPVGGGGGDH